MLRPNFALVTINAVACSLNVMAYSSMGWAISLGCAVYTGLMAIYWSLRGEK